MPRAQRAESRPLPLHAAPLPPRLDVSPAAPRLWQEKELTWGVRGGGRRQRPSLDLPGTEAFRVPWGAGEGGGGPARAGHDVEHVEGAGAGGQSVSIGGAVVAKAHAGEGRKGVRSGGPVLGAARVTPPGLASRIMAAAGSPRPRSLSRSARLGKDSSPFQNILNPLLSYPGLPHFPLIRTALGTNPLVRGGGGVV